MYSEQPVAASLTESVECLWQATRAPGMYTVPPDGCIDIVYSSTTGLSVAGTMTVEHAFPATRPDNFEIGLRFRPGMARAFLSPSGTLLSASELTDRIVPLEELWGRSGRDALRHLNDLGSAAACAALLETLLRTPAAKNPVQRALDYASRNHGSVNLDWIASQASLSARQFRRRCLEESGLTPKVLCRILRFRRARSIALAAPCPNWADIAAQTGYSDQAHLIRDFREFTGRTPMAVFSNR